MHWRKIVYPAVAVLSLAGGSYLATWSWHGTVATAWGQQPEAATSAKPTATVQPEATAALSQLSQAFRAVHSAVKDAVVNIDTSRKGPVAGRGRLPDELRRSIPPEMRPFFPPDDEEGTPPGRGGRGGGAERLQPYGTGSGVVISADGYIVTNNHVVEDADAISVKLSDGRELKAKVIGTDPKTDLALIKIEADKLTYARFGDSDALEVGDWVLAFGSPFGFDQTMTQGIISAKGRQINIIGMHNPALMGLTYENFLQTDAAINPGNSGGPLMNLRGEIVGINTAIASRTGAYNGIGFSIPSADVQSIVKSLKEHGKVVRGYMGVGIVDVRETRAREEARSLGYQGNTGVIVKEVRQDSPGGKGGLQLNDIITEINGKKVDNINQLRNEVARTAPGSKIDLKVFRDGKTVDVSFAAGTQPDTAMPVAGKGPAAPPKVTNDLDDLGLSVSEESKGLVVTDVSPDGLGAEFGLRKGDVIFKVQNKPVKTVDELKSALGKSSLKSGVHIAVRKADGSEQSIFVRQDDAR